MAGDIIVGWNSMILFGKLLSMGTFSLMVEFCSKCENLTWQYTSVYGPNARALKHAFWKELRENASAPEIPWTICGDFNAIFDVWDKNKEPPNLEDIRMPNNFLHDMMLQEPPSVGRRFSWTNGQADPTWVKLDRFIVNCVCVNLLIQNNFLRVGSDHVPIRLEVGNHYSNPRLFRFEQVWSTVEGFQDLVEQWWTECSGHG